MRIRAPMIDVIFEGLIESIEKFWFQLNLRFNLENSESFLAMQRLWNMAMENPLILLGIAVVLIGIPVALSQARKARAGKEKRMDELLGELGGETDAKPLFSDEMQPPTDEDAEFLSMNRFLGKEFSAEPPPDLQDDSTEGKKNDGEWSDEEDLFTAPLHKDFSSLAEPAPDEMMDLEPSTNGTRGGRRESKTKADEAGTPESEMETFELTEASLSPDDNLETDLDDILGVPSNANSAEGEIDLTTEIEDAISEIEGTLSEIQSQKDEPAAAPNEGEAWIDLGAPEEADEAVAGIDVEGLEEEAIEPVSFTDSVDEITPEPEPINEDQEKPAEVALGAENQEAESASPQDKEASEPVAAEPTPGAAPQGKPARNSKDLMERLLKFQEKLEKRIDALGTDGEESATSGGEASPPQEKKIFEPVNMKNPDENTDPKAKNYQQLLESYFLTNKQDKGE